MEEKTKVIPSIKSEIGFTGLNLLSGNIYEDSRNELRFPHSVCTYDKMSQNVTIASALNAIFVLASRAPFYVEAFDESATHVKRANHFTQCMDDMETSWYDVVREAMSFIKYGFCIQEKVYRYRSTDRGSKYNDMKIGIKKLPIRSQASINKWPDTERENDGFIEQQVTRTEDNITKTGKIEIPYSKCLHYRVDPYKGNPEGTSPLAACYESWRILNKLRDTELVAIGKDLNGIPKITLPSEYMSADASDEERAVYENFKHIGRNISNGSQAFIITPSDRDENGHLEYDFNVVDSSASNISAVGPVIQRYTNEILQCLFADVLQMGTVKGGNLNVVDSKATLLELAVEARLKEFCEVINRNLIPELWELNGWDKTKTPKLMFGELSRPDLEVWAKAYQQLSATNNVAKTVENINYVASMLGLPSRLKADATQAEINEYIGADQKMQSRSGDGLAKGSGNGTSDEVAKEDNSANNLSNK